MPDRTKNPVVQVAVLGLLVFLALLLIYGAREPSGSDRVIVVDESDVAQLIAGWQRTWNRLPTREELRGILQNHVRDEVLYQEALKQGLDRNSAVVKRALITQMDLLAEGQGEQRNIEASDIEAYYNLRKDQFISPPEISFRQVYFSEDSGREDLEKLRVQWNEKGTGFETAREAGKATMLPARIDQMPADLIDREFGEGFSRQLEGMEPGRWNGPAPSTFGWHLVYLDSLTPSKTLTVDEVRNEILQQLQYEDKDAAKEQFYTELLQQYDITYRGIAKELVNE
jgi:peptidyl-prolyl cis-trans isomerase C